MEPKIQGVNKEEFYKLISTLTLKYDVSTIMRLYPYITDAYISLGLLPYLSMICVESQSFLVQNGFTISLPSTSSFSFADVRAKLKLFDNSISKAKKQISIIDEIQDTQFKNKLRYRFLSQHNLYYNLGIIADEEGHIIFNTQYLFYLFQDRKFSHFSLDGNDIKQFGIDIGSIISSVYEGLKDTSLPAYDPQINSVNFKFRYKDYNTNNRNFNRFPELEDGKKFTLLLLHVLCSLNFVKYVLGKILPDENIFLFRTKYTALYYSAKTLSLFEDHFNGNHNSITKTIDCNFDSDFRSCMMHYSFVNKEKYLIDSNYLSLSKPFWGLIETFYSGKDFSEISSRIDENIDMMSERINQILAIDTKCFNEL